MSEIYTLSWATSADYDDLSDVMFDAVRNGPSEYTEAQRAQWVPERRSGEEWEARLGRQVVAKAINSTGVVGFMSLDPKGYIDFAFIRPKAQGSGLFRRMFTQIEEFSLVRGDERLWVHASLMAQPAFAAVGFEIIEQQIVCIGEESFERFEMKRRRSSAPRKTPKQAEWPISLASGSYRGQPHERRLPEQFSVRRDVCDVRLAEFRSNQARMGGLACFRFQG